MSLSSFLPVNNLSSEELFHDDISSNKRSKKSRILNLSVLIITISIIAIFGVLSRRESVFPSSGTTQFQQYSRTKHTTLPTSFRHVSPNELYLTATNEYGHFEGQYSWMDDVPGTQLIEPYKSTTLTLTGTYPSSEGYSYQWVLNNEIVDFSGSVMDIVIPTLGKFPIQINIYDNSDNYIGSYSTLLVVKYVKREIRTLTDEDREAFLDAMATIWQYSQDEGVAAFGDKFTSIDTYVTIHSEASNDIMCDQYHEGTGFLTHHLALAVSFEAAIRSVNPAVTVPYWDFSIEGEAIAKVGKSPSYMLEVSDIFTSKWFGSVDSDNHIADGRWAHALMPVAKSGSTTQNSYGFIRSYWNNNPDPEISRHLFDACGSEPEHKTIPSCATHYDILNSADLGTIQLLTPGDGHGPMHVHSGGVWGGCTDAFAKFNEKWGSLLDASMPSEEIIATGNDVHTFTNKWGNKSPRRTMVQKAIVGEYFHIYRSMWRSHMCAVDNTPALLECPKSCDYQTQPFEECTCAVNKLTSGETDWSNLYPCVLNSISNQDSFKSTMPDELLKDLTEMVATSSVLEGEMIESASTADPLFWIIHPVIERLVSAKRANGVTKMGSKKFSKWSSLSKSDWLEYSYYNLNKGTNKFHPEAYRCVGHAADDPALPNGYTLPYTDAIQAIADSDGDGVISNWEFLVAIDPNNVDGNDYVFDNFNWDHCS